MKRYLFTTQQQPVLPCRGLLVSYGLYFLRHIAPNNLRKFGCSDGITGGSHLADLAALLNICFLKQLSLFPSLIRISPLSNRVFLS